jgi:hypothetical protein
MVIETAEHSPESIIAAQGRRRRWFAKMPNI